MIDVGGKKKEMSRGRKIPREKEGTVGRNRKRGGGAALRQDSLGDMTLTQRDAGIGEG